MTIEQRNAGEQFSRASRTSRARPNAVTSGGIVEEKREVEAVQRVARRNGRQIRQVSSKVDQ